MTQIKTILCPVDFSAVSDKALSYAIGFAKELDAEVHVIHVYNVPVYALPEGAVTLGPEIVAKVMESSHQAVNDLISKHKDSGVTIKSKLKEGNAHEAILDEAQSIKADLIVMGTRGRSGLPRLLIGSVAERIIRSSHIPVLTVSAHE
ncbi:MAG: universal stress protein [Myxococcales bacterium]|nr:MAG: universal stress protein [Myxococcales bacterium]